MAVSSHDLGNQLKKKQMADQSPTPTDTVPKIKVPPVKVKTRVKRVAIPKV